MDNFEDNNRRKDRRSSRKPSPERLQPNKAFLIWFVLIGMIILMWSMYTPHGRSKQTWTVSQVLAAAEAGEINRLSLKSDVSRGPEWYMITGEAKNPAAKDHPNVEAKMQPLNFEAQGRLTEDKFNKLTAAGQKFVIQEKPATTLVTEILVNLLPFLLIIGLLYFLFIRQIKMAGKGALSFGKSKAKLLTRDKKKVTFKDVAGCEEAKEEVQEIVEFLKNPKKFQKIGGRLPKGFLMVGPPGTGKTLIAKAVAGEAEVPFFSISGSDFVEMFVGVGAARVRDMFEQGRKSAPCIVFIDEIDAVGRQRGAGLGGGNDEREQTLNSLLVEMDGFDGHEGVIIMAATNRPDVLDSALLRPGRFDRQITIDLPDLTGREEILNIHAKKVKLDKEVDLAVVARNTPGFSGADLQNLANEAALIAARQNKKAVDKHDFDEARDKISFGRERRKLMDDEDKKISAYHEAGHAIIQAIIDDGHLPVHKVTIIPRGQSLGSTMFIPKKDILNHSKKRLLNQICCAMGGRIAEELMLDDITSGASGDIKSATKIARHMVCDWGMTELGTVAYGENRDHIFLGKEISREQNFSEDMARKIDDKIRSIIDEQYQRATDILKKHEEALETLAQALLEHETVEGKHVHEILDTGSIQSPVKATRKMPTQEKEEDKKSKKVSEDITELSGDEVPGAAGA